MARPKKKPNYDADKIMKELLGAVKESYQETGELKLTAAEFDMSPIKVRKLLITAGEYENETSLMVQELFAETKSIADVMAETGLSRASVSGYLPYRKMIYNPEELSTHAERTVRYRFRKAAVEALVDDPCEQLLWEAIIAFEGYKFFTVSGSPFSYAVKKGRGGVLNKELIIDRMKNSKTLSWSSVMFAFGEIEDEMLYSRPKELSDSRGISYIFSIFYRFGLIYVEDKLSEKMVYKRR